MIKKLIPLVFLLGFGYCGNDSNRSAVFAEDNLAKQIVCEEQGFPFILRARIFDLRNGRSIVETNITNYDSSFNCVSVDTLQSSLLSASFDLRDITGDGIEDLVVWYTIFEGTYFNLFEGTSNGILNKDPKKYFLNRN